MRVGVIGNSHRAIQIAQALQALDEGIEIIDRPKEFIIECHEQPPEPKFDRSREPWQQRQKRRRY
jgi:hypothetical protein